MAKSLGAKGTRNYQHRAGRNTSVRSNQMSAHQTPARSVATANVSNGQRVTKGGTTPAALQIRNGVVQRKGSPKMTQFRAPRGMPSKLNNTAASAISTQRWRTATAVAAVGYGSTPLAVIGGFTAHGRNKRNNYATVKLKAAGYKVAKTGVGGVIKPASARTQARAQAKLQRKTGSRPGNAKASVGSRPKSTPPKGGGRRNFRPRRDSKGRWAGSY